MGRKTLMLGEGLLIVALLYLKRAYSGIGQFLTENTEWSAVLHFLFFVAVVDLLRRVIRYFYARRHGLERDHKANFQYGIDNIAKVLVVFGFIVSLFAFFGVDIRTLLTSMSIVAAAIAIISKEYVNDFLVGLYFSFSKDFEINDYVRVGEHKGKITELQVLKIRILNDDDDSVLIPNGKIYNNEIINYTKRDIRLMSIDFEIAITYVGTVEDLEAELIASLREYEAFIEPGSFVLRIVEMKKDYMTLKFQYSLRRLDRELQREIRRKTVRQVFSHIAARISGAQEIGGTAAATA